MDGNGRWALQKGLERSEGHRAGVENVRDIIEASAQRGIEYLSLYAFSTENFKRPKIEVSFLFSLIKEYFDTQIHELIDRGAKLRFIGDLSLFPYPVRMIFDRAQKLTKDNTNITVCFYVGYGSQLEILQAAQKIVDDGHKKVTPELFASYLYTNGIPEPDLLIRTGGEKRISNFLLYQISYTELYFSDVHWPDFKEDEYAQALEEFSRRKRRYGGLDED